MKRIGIFTLIFILLHFHPTAASDDVPFESEILLGKNAMVHGRFYMSGTCYGRSVDFAYPASDRVTAIEFHISQGGIHIKQVKPKQARKGLTQMSFHRPLTGFLFLTLVHLFIALQAPAAYECQQCPKRDIAVFGIAVPPVEQDGMLSYADWMPMHLVGGGILNALFNEDPSRDCLNFVDAQWATSGRRSDGSYQHGMGDLPAPAGAVGNADYIIQGPNFNTCSLSAAKTPVAAWANSKS